MSKNVTQPNHLAPDLGDSPLVAALGTLLGVLIFAGCYLFYGPAGLAIVAFAFWAPLLPLRYLGWKFIAPYLHRLPARILSPWTLTGFYIGQFSITSALFIWGRSWLMKGRLILPLPLAWIGAVLLLITLAIWYAMARKIGWKYRTIAMPETSGGHGKLVTDGIYACSRHPEYLSEPICMLGLFLITGASSILILIVLWAAFNYPVTSLEEAFLAQRFGPEFLRYRQRTPRLWPTVGRQRDDRRIR